MNRTLIVLCGKAPQIVTETLYALHEQGRFPDRVVILTTEAGRDLCQRRLLDPTQGIMPCLLADLGRPVTENPLCTADILTPSFRAGRPVMDIETEEDSRFFFELCLETVFTLALNHTSELLFSIAGGRKTMSAALALAAQCYARPQDTMFHVLVPPEQEANPQFFYPRPSQEAVHITLTPVPFFRMRSQLSPALLRSPASLSALCHACTPQSPLRLTLDLHERSLACEGHILRLPPALFAIYAFFALKEAPCPSGVEFCPEHCHACAMAWSDIEQQRGDILRIYQTVETQPLARGQSGILRLSAENFRSSLAKLKKILTLGFGETLGLRMSLSAIKMDGASRYHLRIPRTHLVIIPRHNRIWQP